MAGPRSLEEDKALDATIACFRDRGLEAPSMRDLAECRPRSCPPNTELRARIAADLEEIAAFFRRNIAAAQAAGTVPAGLDCADAARLLLGIRVLARTNPDRALLEGVARPALALLDGPAGKRISGRSRGGKA